MHDTKSMIMYTSNESQEMTMNETVQPYEVVALV